VLHALPQEGLNPFCRKCRARLTHAQLEADLVQRNVGHLHALSLVNKFDSIAHLRYSVRAVKEAGKQEEKRFCVPPLVGFRPGRCSSSFDLC
jgi:hypothetical protein